MDRQRNYLRNPLPAHSWICPVCRGVRRDGFPRCRRCQSHLERSGGRLADVVVPISYSPRTWQHHHNLRTYKVGSPSSQARWDLLALLLLFLRDHLSCVQKRTGSEPTHVAAVPSTKGRPGPHPLEELIGTRLDLPWIRSATNSRYGPTDHEFHADWFIPVIGSYDNPVHVLVLEDTWTTGARAQSLAHSLKVAGASTAATVVLGRHVDPDYPPSQPLMEAIRRPVFDVNSCLLDTLLKGGPAG